MRVLMVKVGKNPYPVEIGSELKDMRNAIGGGYIEIVPLDNDGTVLICDDEGKLKMLPENRRIGSSVIAGDFFIAGSKGCNLCSISDEKLGLYSKKFHETECITQEDVQRDVGFTIYKW